LGSFIAADDSAQGSNTVPTVTKTDKNSQRKQIYF